MSLCDMDAVEQRRRIGTKEISPVELLESTLKRIEDVNGRVNAIVAMDVDNARAEAKFAEQAVMDGEDLGLLHGLPVGIKDLEATAGLRTTYGSMLYENNVPETDDLSVENVREEGAIILAKTNTPEFGAGANTRNTVYGATGNPFNTDLTPAGSSGGSAAALATGMVSLASGSDYGGSLRTPAGYCGVVGFRPSPGVVPVPKRIVGLSPYSVQGGMGRTVADVSLMLSAQTSTDIRDPFSKSMDTELLNPVTEIDLGSLQVAISTDLGCAPVDNDIRKVFVDKTNSFRGVFGMAEDRDPDLCNVHDAFEITRGINFISDHGERVKNHRDQLNPNVIDNVTRGLEYSAADVAWANAEQAKIYNNVMDVFDEVDLIICPTASVSPFPHQQWYASEINGEKMPTYMRWLALAYGLTMATPAIVSLPLGVDHKGMPFGIQIAGPNGSDRFVLQAAYSLERYLANNPDLVRPKPNLDALKG
jgi:amidase